MRVTQSIAKVLPQHTRRDACAAPSHPVATLIHGCCLILKIWHAHMAQHRAHSRLAESTVLVASSVLFATQEPDLDVRRKHG